MKLIMENWRKYLKDMEEIPHPLTDEELLEEGIVSRHAPVGAVVAGALLGGTTALLRKPPQEPQQKPPSIRRPAPEVQKKRVTFDSKNKNKGKVVKKPKNNQYTVEISPEKKYEMPILSKEQIKGIKEEVDELFNKLSPASGFGMIEMEKINKIHTDLQKLANNAITGNDSDKLLIYAKASYFLQQSRVAYGERGDQGLSKKVKRYFFEVEHDFLAALAKVEDNFAKKLIFDSNNPRLEGAAFELDYKHQDEWQLPEDVKNKEKEDGGDLKKADIKTYKMGEKAYMDDCLSYSDGSKSSVKMCNLDWEEIVRSATSGNKE